MTRRAAVETLKYIWHHGGIASLARRLRGGRGAILRYHSVTDDEATTLTYLDRGLMATTEAFAAQLDFIREHYTVITLDEMVERVHQGRMLPARAVAITFDDGYADNYDHAYRLLRAAGLPATFYVTTGALDGGPALWTAKLRYMVRTTTRTHVTLPAPLPTSARIADETDRQTLFTTLIMALKRVPGTQRCELIEALGPCLGVADFSPLDRIMMTWAQLREMSNNGMTIGAHTVSHPNLPNTEVREAEREIVGSRDAIAAEIGGPVAHFSYPNGRGASHLNDTVKDLVRRAGFRSAVTSQAGCIQVGADPWSLRRVGVYNRHRDMRSFSLDVERGRLASA
jgi:peptidoglycan/xylan/chitin deacetylase (PgdA/CDA1 family)